MRWLARQHVQPGATRTKRCFLLLPVRWGIYWYWLETVLITQEQVRNDFWEVTRIERLGG